MASERVHPSAFRSVHDNISANIGGLSLLVNELGQAVIGVDDDRWLFDEHLNTLRPRHAPLGAGALAWLIPQPRATSAPPKQDQALQTGRPTLEIALGMPKPNVGSLTPSPRKNADKADPEIVGVFREEAQELLAGLREVLNTLLMQPHDLKAAQHARRTFHTLKGSARMAQLSDVGDMAWHIEQQLNGCLASNIPIEADVVKGVLSACREIGGIVDAIPSQVAHLPLDFRATEPMADIAGRSSVDEGETAALADGPQADPRRVPRSENLELSVGASSSVVQRRVGSMHVSAHLFQVFMSESLALAERLSQTVDSWAGGDDPLSPDAESCAHTLAGADATIGFDDIAAFARQLESASHEVIRGDWRSGQLPADMPEVLHASANELMTVLGLLEIEQYRTPQVDRLIVLVARLRDLTRHRPMTSASTIGSSLRSTLATQQERPVERFLGNEGHQRADVAQRYLFDAQVDKRVQALLSAVRDWVSCPSNPEPATDMLRDLHHLQSNTHRVRDGRWADQVRALATQVKAMALLASVDDLKWLQSETEALSKTWSRLRFKGESTAVESVSSHAMQTTLQPTHPESAQADRGGELTAVQDALTDLYAGLERLRSQLSEIENKSRAGEATLK
jgi:chemotaxis protein histidine kinase CheA